MNVRRAHLLVPPHFLVSTAFKKMRWKDEFGKWLPKLPFDWFQRSVHSSCSSYDIESHHYSPLLLLLLQHPPVPLYYHLAASLFGKK